jgi:Carboxypeptidase regulatory-like domain
VLVVCFEYKTSMVMGANDMKRLLWSGAPVSLLLRLTVLVALMLSPFLVQTALADNARIQGTVTDPSGAAVEGVKLITTNIGTNIPYEATSEAGGNYSFVNLPVGTYKVDATKTGFRAFSTSNITLSVDQIYTLNIKLELGQVSETVRVEVSNVQVQTTNTQLGTVISGDTIVAMPLNGRNWVQLQQLQPGVMAGSDRFGTGTGGTAFSTNGNQSQQNSFLINGQDSNDLPLNTALIIPSPDAIAEFNLVTNTINPEYGRNSGAIMNAVIKSGTNSFHGDAFDFYRDTFLNTKDFFTGAAAVFHQNQFGGTIGGPVFKNKTFFFFSYQGSRFRQPQASSDQTVFTQAQRGGDFSGVNFNGTPPPVPDPSTGKCPTKNPGCAPQNPNISPVAMFGDANSPCPVSGGVMCPAGTYYGMAYDNNGVLLPSFSGSSNTNGLFSTGVIPSQDLNSVALNLMNQFVPLPNKGTNLFSFTAVSPGKTDQYLWQVDHTFSSKDSIRSYGFLQSSPSQDTLPFTGATLPGFPELAQRHLKQFTGSWNHIFSPNVLNEMRFGYTRFNFIAVQPVNPVLPSSAGFAINPQDPSGAGLPLMNLTGFFSLGFSNNGPQPRIDQTYQADDNFTYILGKHSLKFGFDGRRFHVTNPFFFSNNGVYNFGGSGFFSTGNPGADFLLGVPDSYGQASGGFIDAGAQMFYVYAQDSWKVSSDFTLNYGLAWQVNMPTTDHFNNDRAINCFRPGQQSVIYPTAPAGLVFPGDNGCTASGYQTGFNHFMPRLGLAWAPHASGFLHHLTGDAGKFSIRAGAGIYFNQGEEELTLQNLTAPPFQLGDAGIGDVGGHPSFAAPFTSINTSTITYTSYQGVLAKNPVVPPCTMVGQKNCNAPIDPASISNKYPFTAPPAGSIVDFSFFEPMSLNLLDPRFGVPYAVNYNLTVQRELPGQMLLSVGYVGSQGRHEERAFELNPAINPAACAADPSCVANRLIQGFVAPQNFRYDPTVFGSLGQQATDGNSVYHSLQASLNKRVSHGLDFLVSYTYSHARDNGSSLENSSFGTRGTNPLVPSLNWGDSAFDGRQRLVLSYTYRIPTLRQFSSGALSRIFKGWVVAGNTTFQTGFPINLADSNFTSLTCWGFSFYGCPDNPDQVAPIQKFDPRNFQSLNNCAGTAHSGNYYFAPASVCHAAFGTFGNTGRDSFHGPGINVTNLALMKDTYINETMYFELRLETFNTFNHVNFNAPSSNVNSSLFGRITSDSNIGPRLVQLAAKFYF